LKSANLRRLHADTELAILERKRILDSAWVVCWVALLAVAAVPWFLKVLAINLATAAWFVFGSGLAYLAVAAVADRVGSPRALLATMRIMPLTSIVLMGLLWHLVGGLSNPVFLIAFVLPVIVSSSTLSHQAHVSAFVSIVVTFAIALAESPDLRWYLVGGASWMWATMDAVASVLPSPQSDLFPDVRTSPAYQFTILTTFTVTQLLVAFLATPLATLLRRLDNRIQFSDERLNEVQGLFQAVLSAEPNPSVIVYADSFQIVQASTSFLKRMLLSPHEIVGKRLFDVVRFDHVDALRSVLSTPSGEFPFSVYRVGNELRIANLHFYRTDHLGVGYLYLGWQELTDLYYLQSAFDAIEDPLVIIAADSRLRYANRTARQLFGDLHFGMHVHLAPTLQGVLQEWQAPTEPEVNQGRQMINRVPYDVARLLAQLPGDAGTCTIAWLHCVAKEEALFEQAVRDPLTGIYNRRYFHDSLARHVAKSRAGRPLVCAYFDLDDFKTINDQAGHAAGDAALLAFVDTVKNGLRAVDVFARLGGDEFAVLFVNCELHVATASVDRMRTKLSATGWTHEGRFGRVSFSAGLAVCQPDDDAERLLQRTDKAVYAAKASGKGRSATES